MSKSLIQVVNNSNQSVLANGIIIPGTVVRRFGPNCTLDGSSVLLSGSGYYAVDAVFVLSASTAGVVQVALSEIGGGVLPGATASATISNEGDVVTLTIPTTVRIKDCSGTKNIIATLVSGTGVTVSNYALRVVKE